MELQDYIELAARTESKLDELKINPTFVVNLLYMYNAVGSMLDQVKKHTFYGKEYDIEQFTLDYASIQSGIQALKFIRVNGTPEEMGEEKEEKIDPRLFHAIIGIATESTELCEGLYKVLTGGEIDLVNLREENGDLNWYQAIFYKAMQDAGFEGTWDDDLETNIAKLKARYPEKFTSDNAINRDTDKERKILEGND